MGGVVGGTLAFWCAGLYQDWLTGWHALLIGFLVAITAPLGDLFESLIKRDLEVKDTGRLFGAHGGVLDRLDAVLFTIVVGYYARGRPGLRLSLELRRRAEHLRHARGQRQVALHVEAAREQQLLRVDLLGEQAGEVRHAELERHGRRAVGARDGVAAPSRTRTVQREGGLPLPWWASS